MKNKFTQHLVLILTFLSMSTVFATRVWYQKATIGGDARHRCTAFSIGNKGYYGGGHINSGDLITYKDYWQYDPSNNTWTQISDYGGGLRYHSSVFVIDGIAYVGGGENATDDYTRDFWKYIPEVNTWIPITDYPGTPRRGGVAFAINGIGYYGTGQSDEGYHTDFYKYDPSLDEWFPIADFIGTARNAAVSFTHEGKAYVGTGHITGLAVQDFFMYDPELDEWTEKASVGGSIRQDAMAFCIDNKGYIGTGNDNEGTDFNDIWEYDFDLDSWTQIEDFPGAKRRYATTFIINNTAYLAGGTDGTNFKDLWAYTLPLGIAQSKFSEHRLTAFPNPSTEKITIHYSEITAPAALSYTVHDLNGKMIQNITSFKNGQELNKSQFGNGHFILTIFSQKTPLKSIKIIFN